MPDLTIETFQQCAQLGQSFYGIGGYSQFHHGNGVFDCSCPGFKFQKTCKHVKDLQGNQCTWHGAYDEQQTEEQEKQQVCPHCGGKTEFVRVAV